MKRFLTRLLLLPLLSAPFLSSSQKVVFTYDNAGNRINREMIVITRGSEDENLPDNDKDPAIPESRFKGDIRIWPSPTEGELNIRISGEVPDGFSWSLFSTDGKLVREGHCPVSSARTDISRYPKGVYVMTVTISNERYTIKILKR